MQVQVVQLLTAPYKTVKRIVIRDTCVTLVESHKKNPAMSACVAKGLVLFIVLGFLRNPLLAFHIQRINAMHQYHAENMIGAKR